MILKRLSASFIQQKVHSLRNFGGSLKKTALPDRFCMKYFQNSFLNKNELFNQENNSVVISHVNLLIFHMHVVCTHIFNEGMKGVI